MKAVHREEFWKVGTLRLRDRVDRLSEQLMCGSNVVEELPRYARTPMMDGHMNESDVVYLFVADDVFRSIDYIDHQLMLHQVVDGASER